MYDVVIVGGGPAGLSAALVLGRCRRRVLLCDDGRPRNAAARELHGYLTRDGTPPLELLRLGREDLRRYDVRTRDATVTDIARAGDDFDVTLDGGEQVRTRTVLLATGVEDHLPTVPGLEECYGISVHHCPYCDGWEVRDRTIVVIGHGPSGAGLSLALTTWSARVAICTNGPHGMSRRQREQLREHGIAMHTRSIERIVHREGHVERLMLADGTAVAAEAIFFSSGQSQRCELPRRMGCTFTRKGAVRTGLLGQTHVAGLYVVGDASRDVQFVIVAAAEGAKAAVAINKGLQARAGLAVAAADPAEAAAR